MKSDVRTTISLTAEERQQAEELALVFGKKGITSFVKRMIRQETIGVGSILRKVKTTPSGKHYVEVPAKNAADRANGWIGIVHEGGQDVCDEINAIIEDQKAEMMKLDKDEMELPTELQKHILENRKVQALKLNRLINSIQPAMYVGEEYKVYDKYTFTKAVWNSLTPAQLLHGDEYFFNHWI